MKKDLTIAVVGLSASGKSTLLYLIKKLLREQGFNVTYDKESKDLDYLNEDDFNSHVEKHYSETIKSLKENVDINVIEKPAIKKLF
jgi:ABC-type lipoprotein export system ATPase subunit